MQALQRGEPQFWKILERAPKVTLYIEVLSTTIQKSFTVKSKVPTVLILPSNSYPTSINIWMTQFAHGQSKIVNT